MIPNSKDSTRTKPTTSDKINRKKNTRKYLNDVLGDVGEVVEGGPLKRVVAIGVRFGERSAVFLDELAKLLEIAVSGGGEGVEDGHFGGGGLGLGLVRGDDLDLRRCHC